MMFTETKKKLKVCLTGGPSAGKTALLTNIMKEFGHRVTGVPEAASILFRGGFPRGQEVRAIVHQQRAIYYLQCELESIAGLNGGDLIVCDRGTIDGVAYWPQASPTFFESLNTTVEKEIARYNWVIHLESAPPPYYETTNPLRPEPAADAHVLDGKVKEAWAAHPHRVIIRSDQQFSKKIAHALEIVGCLLEGRAPTR